MIFNYIEKSVSRKVQLVNILYCTHVETADSLAIKLNCSPLTILEDINYLQESVKLPIYEDAAAKTYYLNPSKNTTLHNYLKQIYQTSIFLNFLEYFLLDDKPKYSEFIKEQHVSTAKGYRLRDDVAQYLNTIGLSLKKNIVTGSPILIRFLAVELTRSFGLNLVKMEMKTAELSDTVLIRIEKLLNIKFSAQEYEFYTLLMQTTLDSNLPCAELALTQTELRGINSNLYPNEYLAIVRSVFQPYWGERTSCELSFSILAFIATNSHIFDKSLAPEILANNRAEFLSMPEVKSLIDLISQEFNVPPEMTDYFYTSIYIFLRDALFRLQPIFSSSYVHLDADKTSYVSRKLNKILKDWNVTNLKISEQHINALYNRLVPILVTNLYKHIYIVSERNIDAGFLLDYLTTVTQTSKLQIDIISKITDVSKETLNDPQNLFVVDKDLSSPVQVPGNNVIYIFFPLSGQQIFRLLRKIFK